MLTEDKRIRIIVGHYGSGKSEFAINYALQLRNITNDKIALSDLDVVNVYFRSREQEKMLESNNIHTIHSSINANALDLPAISAEITTPIRDGKYNYIIDVGGDSIGAKVLGRFSKDIKMTDYDMLFVINGNREKTQTVEEIIRYIKEIENIIIYNELSESSIIIFNYKNISAKDLANYLNKYNICVRAGNHCAKLLKDEIKVKNTCRISLYFYNTKEEIDILINALKNITLNKI